MMWFIIATTLAFILGALGYYLFRAIREKRNLELKRTESQILIEAAKKEAGKIRVEGELQAKEIIERSKSEADRDYREKQKELSKIEKRLQSREENIDKKYESIERKETEISRREREALSKEKIVAEKEKELNSIITEAKKKIEEVAGMSQEAAKRELINIIENEAKHEAAKKLKLIEDELHEKAESKSKDIIALAIQKYAGQYTSEKTISVVNLPNDEMKGRIIGREGRNIRSIEARTGVDIIIDDTPETVVISSLNPIRREVARIALERLIADGRIHPARIEEVVTEVEDDIEKEIQKAGEEAVFDIGAHNMHPELVKLVGKLKYRTSFSQNILNHSLEVAFICGVIAGELGLNVKIARRVGLLHDIGKALDHEVEGSHVEIGEEVVRKYGEPADVVEAVATYHDPQPQSIWAILVQASDAISAARPGARREMYETYVKRIEDIERIASSFRGVEKCYAIQAGREVRVIVQSGKVNDEEAVLLSNEIAKKIQREVAFPGQVKITVIREVRATAYAT
ncbi:MAG: ribonuclease [Candidatus Dadabacteria bacterium]|nr:ribonuclease [Candidatus Dadabacteria bacterium]OGE24796.1 MAG: ribonuclease Y [Candidatus Dadabacteria bacterium RBG_19FT_COMBO_40_33]